MLVINIHDLKKAYVIEGKDDREQPILSSNPPKI